MNFSFQKTKMHPLFVSSLVVAFAVACSSENAEKPVDPVSPTAGAAAPAPAPSPGPVEEKKEIVDTTLPTEDEVAEARTAVETPLRSAAEKTQKLFYALRARVEEKLGAFITALPSLPPRDNLQAVVELEKVAETEHNVRQDYGVAEVQIDKATKTVDVLRRLSIDYRFKAEQIVEALRAQTPFKPALDELDELKLCTQSKLGGEIARNTRLTLEQNLRGMRTINQLDLNLQQLGIRSILIAEESQPPDVYGDVKLAYNLSKDAMVSYIRANHSRVPEIEELRASAQNAIGAEVYRSVRVTQRDTINGIKNLIEAATGMELRNRSIVGVQVGSENVPVDAFGVVTLDARNNSVGQIRRFLETQNSQLMALRELKTQAEKVLHVDIELGAPRLKFSDGTWHPSQKDNIDALNKLVALGPEVDPRNYGIRTIQISYGNCAASPDGLIDVRYSDTGDEIRSALKSDKTVP